jgi:hypothetical protein
MVSRRRDLEPDYVEALPITIGNEEYFEVEFFLDDGTTPRDLSLATAMKFGVKENPDDLDAALIVTVDLNIADPDHDLPNGKVALKIPAAATTGKEAGKYFWDILFEFSAGESPKNWPKVPAEAILIQPIRRA